MHTIRSRRMYHDIEHRTGRHWLSCLHHGQQVGPLSQSEAERGHSEGQQCPACETEVKRDLANEHITEQNKVGEEVSVRCLSTNKMVTGRIAYSGPSSTPGCWVVRITPSTPWPCDVTVAWRGTRRTA